MNTKLAGVKILVAEDSKLNQKIAIFTLQKLGAQVTIANDGQAVVDILKDSSFDVVLMDLQMPIMDGFEATHYIRENISKNLPIIACTASTNEENKDFYLSAGMNGSVVKPYDPEGISNLILGLINN